jgi:hypothetical protein
MRFGSVFISSAGFSRNLPVSNQWNGQEPIDCHVMSTGWTVETGLYPSTENRLQNPIFTDLQFPNDGASDQKGRPEALVLMG